MRNPGVSPYELLPTLRTSAVSVSVGKERTIRPSSLASPRLRTAAVIVTWSPRKIESVETATSPRKEGAAAVGGGATVTVYRVTGQPWASRKPTCPVAGSPFTYAQGDPKPVRMVARTSMENVPTSRGFTVRANPWVSLPIGSHRLSEYSATRQGVAMGRQAVSGSVEPGRTARNRGFPTVMTDETSVESSGSVRPGNEIATRPSSLSAPSFLTLAESVTVCPSVMELAESVGL